MDWVIAGILLLAALAILPLMLLSARGALRSGGFIGGLLLGLSSALDGKAAAISEETRKAEELESEEDSGDRPS